MVSVEGVRELVEPAVVAAGLELWDVEIGRDVVRVLVDRPGGLDLDAVAVFHRTVISPLLDEHPELTPDGPYQLEVSSPGIERSLRTLDQFGRYIGSEITVKTSVPVDGSRRHHGVLLAADESSIRMTPKDAPAGAEVQISRDQIERARTVLVWGPAASPSARGPAKRRTATRQAATTSSVAASDPKDTAS